jgi:hypothetical protein
VTILSAMQPHYLPWLGYFELIRLSDKFVFLDDVQMTNSKSYFNRTKVSTNGITKWSTVPLDHSTTKGPLNLVKTSSDDWLVSQSNTLGEWYRGSPGVDNALQFLSSLPTTSFLCDFNTLLVSGLLEELHIDTPVYVGSTLEVDSSSTDRLIDICLKLNANHYLTGHGAYNYLDHLKFEDHDIQVSYMNYDWDCFGLSDLADGPYLSIFDYLSRDLHDMSKRSRSNIIPWRDFNKNMIGFWTNVARDK